MTTKYGGVATPTAGMGVARGGIANRFHLQMEFTFPGGISTTVENAKRLRALKRGGSPVRWRTGEGPAEQILLSV